MINFLTAKILCSTFFWLGSIPIIAVFVLHTYGSLHPVGFPHFCGSVVVGCLVSVTYSLLLCVREMLQFIATDFAASRQLVAIQLSSQVFKTPFRFPSVSALGFVVQITIKTLRLKFLTY